MPRSEAVTSYQLSYAVSPRTVQTQAPGIGAISLRLRSPMVILNLLLGSIAALLVLMYVLSANAITTHTMQIRSLNEQAQQQSELHTALTQEKMVAEDPAMLAVFAGEHGMVQASNGSYVFEGNSVAYQH